MTRTIAAALATVALAGGVVACQSIAGLGDFVPDDDGGSPSSGPAGGGGGAGGSAPSAGGGDPGSTASSSSVTTTTTSSTGTGEACAPGHLLLAEIRTRGPDDGNQDFVEILNPTGETIVLDASWRLEVQGETTESYGVRWTGDGTLSMGPGDRLLLANSSSPNPLGGATADALYGEGIRDGASVVLYRGSTVVDALCFLCDRSSFTGEAVCEGAPLMRVAGCSEPGDRSVRRRSVAGVEGCADTGDNAADLEEVEPSTPQGLGG